MSTAPMQLAAPVQDDERPIQPDDPSNMGIPSIPMQLQQETQDDYVLEDELDYDTFAVGDEIASDSEYFDALYGDDDEDDVVRYSLTDSLMLHLVSEHGLLAAVLMDGHEQYRWHHEAHTTGVQGLDMPAHRINDLSWRPEVAMSLMFGPEPVTFPGPEDEDPGPEHPPAQQPAEEERPAAHEPDQQHDGEDA